MPETYRNVRGALLALHAQTALHPGAGTALGTVDLPVQRERHTGWPTIAGSALKGILRDAVRERVKDKYQDDGEEVPQEQRRTRRRKADEEDAEVVALFGPGKVDDNSAHAGALSVTDARLLAFPVRSLKGVFAWVSCRAVLQRLQRDAELAGCSAPWNIPAVENNRAAVRDPDGPCVLEKTQVVLEEFDFAAAPTPGTGTVADWIAAHVLPDRPEYEGTRNRFKSHFLVLSDDDFTHFVRHATEVTARIALDYETKTVKGTALFYQEFLPAETLFYAVVLANAARARNGNGADAAGILATLRKFLEPVPFLQIGGDETTGKGICATRLTLKEDLRV